MSKALLVFPVATQDSPSTAYEVSVVRYTSGYQVQIDNSATRYQRHGYVRRIKELELSMTIQCRSVAEFDAIKQTIAVAQRIALASVEKSMIRFAYPALGKDYLGFIALGPAGVSRFIAAPQLSFIFSPFKDTINTVTNQYSTQNGTWKDIAGPDLAVIMTPDGPNAPDEILKNSRPVVGRNIAV